MGTNFYLYSNNEHVGKRSYMGEGKMKFTWRMPMHLKAFEHYLSEMRPWDAVLVDEYQRIYNMAESKQMVDSIAVHDVANDDFR